MRSDDIRPYIKMPRKRQDSIKDYNPHEGLVDHLKEQLQRRKEIRAGREPQEDEEKRNNRIYRMKNYYLDKHIFPAMTNLAFFFEVIAEHPELEDLYIDDIRDLLGVRRKKLSDKHRSYGFMFCDLLRNILKVSKHSFKGQVMQDDFRLKLNDEAEKIVAKKVSTCLSSGYESEGGRMWLADFRAADLQEVIQDDFKRTLAWTGILARNIDDSPDDEEPHKTFDFDTDKLLR